MAWFGFGSKKRRDDDDGTSAADDSEVLVEADDARDDDETDESAAALGEAGETYEGRGERRGPWDVDDEETPDYDDYLDLGAYYLPFLQGIELRVKATRSTNQVLGCTITLGGSSLEIEAFAAPKTLGLWDDIKADLLEAHEEAEERPGVFGTEVVLPVAIKGGKTVITRIVGVDGPRWMLRGIFSGSAATSEGEETDALNGFFSDVVVDRGEEPLAPRDLIPMHPPVSPSQRKEQAEADAAEGDEADAPEIPSKPQGPFDSDQQTEVKTTLSRGPMFSEVR